jgi:hypothetical protein
LADAGHFRRLSSNLKYYARLELITPGKMREEAAAEGHDFHANQQALIKHE